MPILLFIRSGFYKLAVKLPLIRCSFIKKWLKQNEKNLASTTLI